MKYVIFDLDETLSDHKYACTKGIEAMMELHPVLQNKSSEQLESEFWAMLNGNYNHILDGSLRMEDARLERIFSLFKSCGANPPDNIIELADIYVNAYGQHLRAVPGIAQVLSELKQNHIQIGVLTNGFTEVQKKKLRDCKIHDYIDVLVTSEEAGITKPDKRIFDFFLSKGHVTKDEVVMVGDSLTNDIEGASSAGIKSFWLNRRNEACPEHIRTTIITEPIQLLDFISM